MTANGGLTRPVVIGAVRATCGGPDSVESRRAVEDGRLLRLHPCPPNAGCPVGHGIGPALRPVHGGLHQGVVHEPASTTIADLPPHARPAAPTSPLVQRARAASSRHCASGSAESAVMTWRHT